LQSSICCNTITSLSQYISFIFLLFKYKLIRLTSVIYFLFIYFYHNQFSYNEHNSSYIKMFTKQFWEYYKECLMDLNIYPLCYTMLVSQSIVYLKYNSNYQWLISKPIREGVTIGGKVLSQEPSRTTIGGKRLPQESGRTTIGDKAVLQGI
jgi:hypothetical protein